MINLLSTSDWIAIIGLLITLILYQRVRKKKLIFLSKRHYKLNNVDFRHYQNIKMTFEDEEINDYLHYISGTLILSGDTDVDSNTISHAPSIILEDETGIWKSQRILKKTDLLQCDLIVSGNTLSLETGDLKSRDYIKIDGFYQAKKQGIKFRHRILDVSNNVEVISEESASSNTALAIVLSLTICSFLYFIIDLNTERKPQPIKEKVKYTQQVNLTKPTKQDSIIGKRYQYDDLYFIHGDSLKYDSIFKKNNTLNKKLNKRLHTRIDKAIDSMYENKNDYNSQLQKLSLQNHFSKDSVYFVDNHFLYRITDSIFSREIIKVKKINPNKKFKINDSISISFIFRDYYDTQKKEKGEIEIFTFRNIGTLIISILTIIFVFINFHLIYNLYLLKKYRKYFDIDQ